MLNTVSDKERLVQKLHVTRDKWRSIGFKGSEIFGLAFKKIDIGVNETCYKNLLIYVKIGKRGL